MIVGEPVRVTDTVAVQEAEAVGVEVGVGV